MLPINHFKDYEEFMITTRRDIHMNPEPGFQEFRTSKLIKDYLIKWGYDVIDGIGTTGMVASIHGKKPGKTIGLRADIDALKMQEENDVPYKSLNDGLMHSCGHDTHTSMLLGAAKYFSDHNEDFNGTIKLIFQSAEEGPMPGGGIYVVEGGHIDDCDGVFGLHITTRDKRGDIIIKKGEAMAAPDEFQITVKGTGTHASAPHTGKDPIIAATAIIQAIQTILSRQISPLESAVISVCTIHGGSAFNIIPDDVTFTGTIRTLNNDVRMDIFQKLEATATSIASSYGCRADVKIIEAYPPLINDPKMSDFVMNIAKEVVGEDHALWASEPSMGGEDFSYYLQKKPGSYFWLGGRDPKQETIYYNHNPKFDVDESSFVIGMAMHVNIAFEFLK
ncbi:M20 metallopeptidase family protein [Candidatus Xianfuyuplasma coldseepsis]|uniref:Amidohydrolase n=1 Tax=Candidatus Xianfuyuplasma coldseepsis TaxID=2782163 RepID=A0A7L7KSS4_9MOLU|nr:M20 family metallopeptidase [Xianfuyuplasma coldseepsis]QMS85322.1 amidohydrolase [Xianfuyuplasma coldseepsis]